jgi:hypothetical protein
MSFFPDLAPLTNKINEFTQTQSLQQKEMIALLKQIHLELTEIKKQIKLCQISKT